MKKRYHTEVVLKAPKVPYRETIRGKADVQGRHKKQTGGHGQYGDCKIKMEPLPRGGEFEFVNDIFGGAIPKNYIPAIEKGIKDAAARGYLAGFPVVDFRVILYDGSYHDVDSNDMSFQMAGRIAFRKAMETAKPTLLEPVMHVEITVPDEFAGSIMGDLNSRRGRIQGMDNKGGNTIVKAEVPMSEMLTYGVELTSMTQGRGRFNMEMHHYDVVPAQLQEKIIEKAKAERGEVKEEESGGESVEYYAIKVQYFDASALVKFCCGRCGREPGRGRPQKVSPTTRASWLYHLVLRVRSFWGIEAEVRSQENFRDAIPQMCEEPHSCRRKHI